MLLTFILEVASEILGTTISDLIMGKSKTARKVEIEIEVNRLLAQHMSNQNIELRQMHLAVMKEIEVLSRRDPDLVVTTEEIGLRDKPKPPFETELRIQDQIVAKMFRLGTIIEERRHELGLPLSPLEHEKKEVVAVHSEVLSQEGDVVWEETTPKGVPSKWEQEFKDMDRRIRQRRSSQ